MNILIPSRDTEPYYPSHESQGGWRFLKKQDDIHHFTHMDSKHIWIQIRSIDYLIVIRFFLEHMHRVL